MSLMKTLAKVAVGVAVAKGAKSMMQRSAQGGAGQAGGLGGLLGGLAGGGGAASGGLGGLLGSLAGGAAAVWVASWAVWPVQQVPVGPQAVWVAFWAVHKKACSGAPRPTTAALARC